MRSHGLQKSMSAGMQSAVSIHAAVNGFTPTPSESQSKNKNERHESRMGILIAGSGDW